MNVTKTRNLDLCVSCEICNAVCPVDAIHIEFDGGQFLPKVDQKTCIDCEKCVEVCPGLDITVFDDENFEDKITGSYIEGYSAYTKDREILKNSTSGGAITQLVIELLKEEEYDGAFVLPFDMFKGNQARLCLAETEEEVRKASKSKYLPASVYNVVKKLESEEKPKYIIVSTPCQLSGIKNFIDLKEIDDEKLLFLGLFCDKTLNFNFLNYIEEKHGTEREKLVKFDYKNKEKDGWPGHPKLYFDSSREEIIDRKERMRVKEFFQLERCLYCLDKLNRQADMSFGDCYITGKENPGRSSVIIRTEKGKEVWEKYKHSFTWDESSVESIKKSQKISQKRENLEFAKAFKKTKKSSELKKRIKKIELGKKSKFDEIKSSIPQSKIKKISEFLKGSTALELSLGLSTYYMMDTFTKNGATPKRSPPKNVVVFGGELFNKGAQAMTFTVIDQLKRRFPIENIYLLSSKDFDRDEIEKNRYNFEIIPFSTEIGKNLLLDDQFNVLEKDGVPPIERKVKEVLKNSDLVIDISGYHLSSQTGEGAVWAIYSQMRYISRIVLSKNYSIPYFIFPQSIGPFDYSMPLKPVLYTLLSRYMTYPEKIHPREPQGVEALKPFTKENVERQRDIVLLNPEYDLKNIFKTVDLKEKTIDENSVGIIPNNQVIKRTDKDDIYDLYKNIIQKLIRSKKKVYILRHSQEDLYICEGVKDMFSNNENVILLSEDMNAIELENIIKQFEFIIGSRYHSIIHAYKNGIPSIVIGWAIKYKELLKDFDQENYHFDGRKRINKEELLNSIEKMINECDKEKNKINSILTKMEKNYVFKELEKYFS